MYGFLGASKGFLPCVPIAAAVTATGRAMIAKTKAMAETLVPGSRVVYGDTGECAWTLLASPLWVLSTLAVADSVMVIFELGQEKRHDMAAHFEVAERVAKAISDSFPRPIELEFEKW